LYLAFDMKIITKSLPFNFSAMIGFGLVFAVSTGMISVFLGEPFLKQFFGYFHFLKFGEVECTTVLLFDLGVNLVFFCSDLIIIFLGDSFLKQFFSYFQFLKFGEVEWTTALLFDLGVYLVVVGSALTIILAIAEDDD